MVTSINLGSTFQSNGKTVFGGGASGLDTEKVVNDLVSIKKVSVTSVETKLDVNSKRIAAYDELKSILDNFEQAASFLRNKPGVNTAKDNIFEYRTVSLSSNSASAAENFISVTAQPGAAQSNYDITVSTVAKAKIQTSDAITVTDLNTSVVEPTSTAGRFTAGDLDINGTLITLEAGDTLNDILSKVNAQKATTGVEATVIKTGTDSYRLQFSATTTGLESDFDVNIASNNGAGGVLENIGFNNTQAASNALFTLNGIAIESQSNTITDAVNGLSFTIKQPTGGTTVTAKIEADTEIMENGIVNFVNAYNEFRLFLGRQTERNEEGLPTEDAVLANDSMLRTISTKINNAINSIVGGLEASAPKNLRDIGINFVAFEGDAENPPATNLLEIDTDALRDALSTNMSGVRSLFELQMTSNNSDFYVFESQKGVQVNEFTVNVDTVAGTAEAVFTVGGVLKTVALDYSTYSGGVTLKGQAGTEFEGLTFIYANTVDASINVKLTQGLADMSFVAARDITADGTGLIDTEKTTLQENSVRLEEEIGRINEQIENYRQTLLDKFSALEQAIAKVNSILQYLDAQANARNAQ